MSNATRMPTPSRSCAGVTLVELATVVVLVGILATIAIPRTRDAVTHARATAVTSDMRTAQLAIFDYFLEHDGWPPDAAPGEVPEGLSPFLPQGFSFLGEHARLDYVDLREGGVGRWGENIGLTAFVDGDAALLRRLEPTLARLDPGHGDGLIAVGAPEGEAEAGND